jgi:glycosyltransferase involved in cell wall biosynthesis
MALKLSIVIPVYQSQKILTELVRQIVVSTNLLNISDQFELILVCDASPDGSWEVITKLAKQNSVIKGILLQKNYGAHNATMAGLHYVKGEIIVIMDDDLQHPPSEIENLIKKINEGADVCYTNYNERQHPGWKILGSHFNNWIVTLLMRKPAKLYLSSFKAIRYKVVQELIKFDGPNVYLDGLILNITRSIKTITIEHQPRYEGKGNYNLKRSISLWLTMVTSFSMFPLRIATFLGICLVAISLLVLGIAAIEKIFNPLSVLGFTLVIATVLFVGGVQAVCVGVVGEYLGRVYSKLNGKPQFVIREIIGKVTE